MSCKLGDKCDNVFACNVLRPNVELLGCNFYKPKKPMTNEEYLRSLNTEQLAKVLLSFCQYPCEICKVQCDDGNACTYNKALNTIVEWLKQPHTVKE